MRVIRENENLEEAVDKVPVFSKFDRVVKVSELEKMFMKHYPHAVKRTLKIKPGIKGDVGGNRSEIFASMYMENKDPDNPDYDILTGALIVVLENDKTSVRVYSYIRIDG